MSGELFDWDEIYTAALAPPWEIGRPQPALAEVVAAGVQTYLTQLSALAAPGAALYVLAVPHDASAGCGITEDYLRTAFPEPAWTDLTFKDIVVDAGTLSLPGLLMDAVRTDA